MRASISICRLLVLHKREDSSKEDISILRKKGHIYDWFWLSFSCFFLRLDRTINKKHINIHVLVFCIFKLPLLSLSFPLILSHANIQIISIISTSWVFQPSFFPSSLSFWDRRWYPSPCAAYCDWRSNTLGKERPLQPKWERCGTICSIWSESPSLYQKYI